MSLLRLATLSFLVTDSCVPGQPTAHETPDASTSASISVAPSVAPSAHAGLIARLRAIPVFADHLGVGGRLERSAQGFRLARAAHGAGSWAVAGEMLDATLPGGANAPLRLALAGDPDVWIELVAEGASSVVGDVVEGAVVHEDALLEADVVHVAEASGRVEEIRVLKSARASSVARYVIARGAGVASVRVRDQRLEVVDGEGRVRIASEPMFAVDALGVRRDLSVRLEANALVAELETQGLAYPIAVDPTWTAVSGMLQGRSRHQALVLPNGKVMVIGGGVANGADLASVEIYDPAARTWSTGPSMTGRRNSLAAVRLQNDKILAIAGTDSGASNAELYNPATNTWAAGGTLVAPRYLHRAVVLSNGKVLVTGGVSSVTSATLKAAELYDPATNQWTVTGPMITARHSHSATLLPNGKVLVTCGYDRSPNAEVYDPGTGAWSAVTPLPGMGMELCSAARLSNGKVLLAGGAFASGGTLLFDSATNGWSDGGSLTLRRDGPTTTLLPNGKVLVVGGVYMGPTADLLDPTTGVWTAVGPTTATHFEHAATLLPNGQVLVTGDNISYHTTGNASTAELFSLALPAATPCTLSGECASGFCTDGVCCNAACTAQCLACDVAGKIGTCSAVTAAPPHGTRTSCSPYLCNAGACATTCAVDADCTVGRFCGAGACVPLKANGATCTSKSQCSSGNCVDGVCCNSACGNICQACDVVGKVGTCSLVTGAPHGTARGTCPGADGSTCGVACNGLATQCSYAPATTPCGVNGCSDGIETHTSTCDGVGKCNDAALQKSCSPFVCGPTTCKTSCTSSVDCPSGYLCSGTNCVAVTGLGNTCTTNAECATGFCTDGVCCGVASCGAGSACNTANRKGICMGLAGASCAAASQCASGACVDDVCCDSACPGSCNACDVTGKLGTCSPVTGAPHGTRPSCGGFACAAGACATACAVEADCVPGSFCNGTACVPRMALGSTCAASSQCISGHCVDGVCCNAACADACAACDVAGMVGTCSAVTGAPHGARPACAGTATICGGACDGVDTTKCKFTAAVTLCSGNACTGGTETHASICDGLGACNDIPRSCGAFACDVASCKSTCAADTDCLTGYFCKSIVCVPLLELAESCSGSSQCKSGFCTDGVCCDAASCGAGSVCNSAAKKGRCAKPNGTACTAASECAEGFCVDSVCCESACAGQCQACDVGGSVGRCTGVSGAAHGSRPKCDGGGENVCAAMECDGPADPMKCVAFTNGASVTCKPASCGPSGFTSASTCDGAGTCKTPLVSSCAPFGCNDKGCLTSCAKDEECASGFHCDAGRCLQGATCSADGLSSVPKTGGAATPCSPYICGTSGDCLKLCSSSSDCAIGYTCDQGSCASGQPAGDDGGCATSGSSPARSRAPTGILAALFLASAVGARARRRHRP